MAVTHFATKINLKYYHFHAYYMLHIISEKCGCFAHKSVNSISQLTQFPKHFLGIFLSKISGLGFNVSKNLLNQRKLHQINIKLTVCHIQYVRIYTIKYGKAVGCILLQVKIAFIIKSDRSCNFFISHAGDFFAIYWNHFHTIFHASIICNWSWDNIGNVMTSFCSGLDRKSISLIISFW